MMQLAIAAIGLLTALVPLVCSYRQVKTRKGRTRAGWLLGVGLTLAVLSLVTPYVIIPRLLPQRPFAEIQSPAAGERISRPQDVDIELNGSVPKGDTVWLGYQNQKGGPVVVQAIKCVPIAERLDCGPLYVGHDEKDRAEFRIFVATANASATASLSAHGTAEPGDNLVYPSLPDGATVVSEERHITLR